ncbi:MAG: hybrid sensor histidine kinase/response regulator [Desulfobacteraceae bacterium]|nr:MAG: hybrid sensor histidine kinase/response regulator [Desulfobacteraceae bacterium]
MRQYEILLVDDEASILRMVGTALKLWGYEVTTALNGVEAIEALEQERFDLVITDLHMGEPDGIEVLKKAKELAPRSMVIVLTGDHDVNTAVNAFRCGADDYLLKPCSLGEMAKRISHCLEAAEMERPLAPIAPDHSPPADGPALTMGMISHDIRGPLISMVNSLKILRKWNEESNDKRGVKETGKLLRKSANLLAMAEDYLGLTFEAPGGAGKREVVDLADDVIGAVLDELNDDFKENGTIVKNGLAARSKRQSLPINCNRVWLKSAFRNLFANAIAHGGSGCQITLDIEERGRIYDLRVINTGPAVPVGCRERLFSRFGCFAVKREEKKNGGLGLYLTKKIVKDLGGEIRYEAAEEGSTFVLTLLRHGEPPAEKTEPAAAFLHRVNQEQALSF